MTAGKFLGTMLLLGAGLCAVVWSWTELAIASWDMAFTLLFRWSLSIWELSRYRLALEDETCLWHKSALILREHLPHHIELRALLLVATGLLIPVLVAASASRPWMLTISLVLTFASQLIERHYFFTAAAGSKMPGN
jgi:DMSO reductase anchor subunit